MDKTGIALDYLRRAQNDLQNASTVVSTRIQLARQYGATEDDITNALKGG